MAKIKRAPLPLGALNDLINELHLLHLQAGYPSSRELARRIEYSHTSVYNIFKGATVPNFGILELLVEALASQAKLDEQAALEHFHSLWTKAADDQTDPKDLPQSNLSSKSTDGPESQKTSAVNARAIADLIPDALSEMEAINTIAVAGRFRVPTGFDELDNLLGGWSQASLVVLAGRPSSGKTTLLLNFARIAAIKYQIPSLVISGELNDRELQFRILSAEARVALHHTRTGQMGEQDWIRVTNVMSAIAKSPIHIATPREFTLDQAVDDIAAIKAREDIGLVLVDSLQWLAGDNILDDAAAEIILRKLRRLAERLRIPILITANAGRPQDYPIDSAPIRLLRNSEPIEDVADVVISLERPDQDDPWHNRAGEADLRVAKNRNGPTGVVTVAYQYHYSRFVPMAPLDTKLIPVKEQSEVSLSDRQRYTRLLEALPPDGATLIWLKQDFMSRALPENLVLGLENFTRSHRLDIVGFDNNSVSEACSRLIDSIDEFSSAISWSTWSDKSHRWLSIPMEWRESNSSKWADVNEKIGAGRDAVIASYDDFLRVCHENNIDI